MSLTYKTLAIVLSILTASLFIACGGSDNVVRDDGQPGQLPESDFFTAEKYFEKKDYLNAAVAYRNFIDRNQKDKNVILALYREGISYLNLSNESEGGDPAYMEKASAAFEEIIIEHSNDPHWKNYGTDANANMKRCHDWLAKYYFDLGLSCFEKEDYIDAKENFNKASRFVGSVYFKDAQTYRELCESKLSGKGN